jgi:hypothetical protein
MSNNDLDYNSLTTEQVTNWIEYSRLILEELGDYDAYLLLQVQQKDKGYSNAHLLELLHELIATRISQLRQPKAS